MAQACPFPISAEEHIARHQRASEVARHLGFVGIVEYRHVHSQAGDAQYGLAAALEKQL